MTAPQPTTQVLVEQGEFGADVAWSQQMATGHRIDLAALVPAGPLGVDEAQLAAVARRQVRRLVDADGRPRGWLLFGQLRPELTARLLDLHLRQRHATTLAAEVAAGRVGDHLRLAYAASAHPPLDPEIPPTRWPVTVLDAQPAQSHAM